MIFYQFYKRGMAMLALAVSLVLLPSLAMAATPTISAITPTAVHVGTTITITGIGFSPTPSKNYVIFTGNAIQIPTAATETHLTLTVPDNAMSGPVKVVSNGVSSAVSSVQLTMAPEVTGFSPPSVSAGQVLKIHGYSFSSVADNNVVNFAGGVTARAVTSTNEVLSVVVPNGAITGAVTVTTNNETSPPSSELLDVSCSADFVQTLLGQGKTPLEVYNACGKSTKNLYGRTYGGGLLAYLNPSDGSGLIAAPSDYYYTTWGGYLVTVKGTQTGIGTGKSNTDTIIATLGEPSPANGGDTYAAYLSKTQHYNGYTDWFLPSIDELNEIVVNLKLVWAEPDKKTGAGCVYQDSHFKPYLVEGYYSSSGTVRSYNGRTSYRGAAWSYRCGYLVNESIKPLVRKYPSAVRLARYFTNDTGLRVEMITPSQQIVGSTIDIIGNGFSAIASKNIVLFTGGAVALPSTATASKLTVTVPAGAETGPIRVMSNGEISPDSAEVLVIETH